MPLQRPFFFHFHFLPPSFMMALSKEPAMNLDTIVFHNGIQTTARQAMDDLQRYNLPQMIEMYLDSCKKPCKCHGTCDDCKPAVFEGCPAGYEMHQITEGPTKGQSTCRKLLPSGKWDYKDPDKVTSSGSPPPEATGAGTATSPNQGLTPPRNNNEAAAVLGVAGADGKQKAMEGLASQIRGGYVSGAKQQDSASSYIEVGKGESASNKAIVGVINGIIGAGNAVANPGAAMQSAVRGAGSMAQRAVTSVVNQLHLVTSAASKGLNPVGEAATAVVNNWFGPAAHDLATSRLGKAVGANKLIGMVDRHHDRLAAKYGPNAAKLIISAGNIAAGAVGAAGIGAVMAAHLTGAAMTGGMSVGVVAAAAGLSVLSRRVPALRPEVLAGAAAKGAVAMASAGWSIGKWAAKKIPGVARAAANTAMVAGGTNPVFSADEMITPDMLPGLKAPISYETLANEIKQTHGQMMAEALMAMLSHPETGTALARAGAFAQQNPQAMASLSTANGPAHFSGMRVWYDNRAVPTSVAKAELARLGYHGAQLDDLIDTCAIVW
jgi:hypothetical protein